MIHLAFCSDKNYLPWTAVPAKTAIKHSAGCGPISIHLVLSEDCRNTSDLASLIMNLSSQYVSVYHYFVDASKLSGLNINGHGSIANYFRLLIPELLPADIDKVIYLDCDLLVLDSLLPLWETDLEGAPLAAVSDMSLFEGEAARLGIPYMSGTFNSGVMVMNLSLIRQEGFHFNCIDKAKEFGSKIVYWDQDVLNIVASGRWLKLDNSWNVQHGCMLDPIISDKYSVEKPKIIHFSGNGLKPWQSRLIPYSDNYMDEFHNFVKQVSIAKSSIKMARKVNNGIKSQIKMFLKIVAGQTIFSPSIVYLLKPVYVSIIKNAGAIISSRKELDTALTIKRKHQEIVSNYFSSLCVMSGPFQGMKYSTPEAIGSALLPKLSGSYETEISQLFTPEWLSEFTDFLDIGCAEGYYAVGVATIAPNLNVHAYDINADALRLCKAMAERNNVSDRVSFNEKFSLSKLAKLKSSKNIEKILLLCDCEGYEASIFSAESFDNRHLLRHTTIIIESHEFIRPGMADHIIKFFAGSHSLQRVLAVGDLLRPSIYSQFIPAGCDHETATIILAEYRPAPMEWLIFYPLPDV